MEKLDHTAALVIRRLPSNPNVHPVIFDAFNDSVIRSVAFQTKGTAGLIFGMDAYD